MGGVPTVPGEGVVDISWTAAVVISVGVAVVVVVSAAVVAVVVGGSVVVGWVVKTSNTPSHTSSATELSKKFTSLMYKLLLPLDLAITTLWRPDPLSSGMHMEAKAPVLKSAELLKKSIPTGRLSRGW